MFCDIVHLCPFMLISVNMALPMSFLCSVTLTEFSKVWFSAGFNRAIEPGPGPEIQGENLTDHISKVDEPGVSKFNFEKELKGTLPSGIETFVSRYDESLKFQVYRKATHAVSSSIDGEEGRRP